jgi:deoxyadenosine/deoxycytidine kinase
MVWVSIEGSIGCGKTTIMNELDKNYGCNNIGVYKEPINDWNGYLNLFYSNEARYSFLMQMRANLSFTQILNKSKGKEFIITERSSYSAQHVFSRMLLHHNRMNQLEYKLIQEFVDTTQSKKPDYFIYLKTVPEVCYNRITLRGDKPINIDYLKSLGIYHEQVFGNNSKCYVIETSSKNREQVLSEVINIIRTIKLIN